MQLITRVRAVKVPKPLQFIWAVFWYSVQMGVIVTFFGPQLGVADIVSTTTRILWSLTQEQVYFLFVLVAYPIGCRLADAIDDLREEAEEEQGS